MSPVETFSQLIKLDPKVGRLVLGGLAVIAAGAIALGFGSDLRDAAVTGIYVLLFAMAVTLLAAISNKEIMRTTLCWMVVVAFGGWMVGLFESALQLTGKLPRMPCYIRMPVELPEVCERRLTTDVLVIGGAVSGQLRAAPGGPERLWLAQADPVVDAAAPADPALAASTNVIVQFTDNVEQTDSAALSLALAAAGWQVAGAEEGGEAVAKGPDRNEVRFFHAEDETAAIALAQSVFALTPDIPLAVRDFTRLGRYAPEGQLELWLDQAPVSGSGT